MTSMLTSRSLSIAAKASPLSVVAVTPQPASGMESQEETTSCPKSPCDSPSPFSPRAAFAGAASEFIGRRISLPTVVDPTPPPLLRKYATLILPATRSDSRMRPPKPRPEVSLSSLSSSGDRVFDTTAPVTWSEPGLLIGKTLMMVSPRAPTSNVTTG